MSGRKGKRASEVASSDEDSALWAFVAASVRPARGKQRVPDVETPDETPRATRDDRPAHAVAEPSSTPHARIPVRGPVPSTCAPPQAMPSPDRVVLQRKRARRIARGTEEIEARLDLHGLTQAAAHTALSGFVKRCSAAGLRLVLVITGKGGVETGHDDDVMPRQRGVLKRNVPRWLAEPDLAPLVVSHWTAHVRHGGAGALYVQLRVKR